MAKSDALMRLRSITKNYGKQTVVNQFSAEFTAGKVVGLLGPNGAGKTTLMSIMATLVPPSSGEVEVFGTSLRNAAQARELRRLIGYLPQKPEWIGRFTASEMVQYTGWLHGMPSSQLESEASKQLMNVGLADVANRKMRLLSGGMIQRVCLAAALIAQPKLLLLDEPTVGLDPAQRIGFRKLISRLPDTCVILSTHLVEDISAIADEVFVLVQGEQKFRGSVAEFSACAKDPQPGLSVMEQSYLELAGMDDVSA